MQLTLTFYIPLTQPQANCNMFSEFSSTPHNRDSNKRLVKIIYGLLDSQHSVAFRKPVPHKALGLENYRKVVKKPIDLNQIRRQNNELRYKTIEEALDDIQLCWENCKRYNQHDSEVYKQAINLQAHFWKAIHQLFPDIYEHAKDRLNQREILMSSEPTEAKKETGKPKNVGVESVSNLESVDNNQSASISNKLSQPKKGISGQHEPSFKMEEEEQPSKEIQHEEPVMSNQHNKSLNEDVTRILVNTNETPSKAELAALSRHTKHYLEHMQTSESKNVMGEILEILMTHEKSNKGSGNPKNPREISFSMNNIHLSTFYRICRVVNYEAQDHIDIIG